MKLQAFVFQDFKLIPFTMKENIVFDKASDIPGDKIMEAWKRQD